MMMAEGVSRRLQPELNIWTLARPLIEQWMAENRGPEARLREAADEALRAVQRLPGIVERIDRISEQLAGAGLRVHPASAGALGRRNGTARWAFALAAAAFALALAAALGL